MKHDDDPSGPKQSACRTDQDLLQLLVLVYISMKNTNLLQHVSDNTHSHHQGAHTKVTSR